MDKQNTALWTQEKPEQQNPEGPRRIDNSWRNPLESYGASNPPQLIQTLNQILNSPTSKMTASIAPYNLIDLVDATGDWQNLGVRMVHLLPFGDPTDFRNNLKCLTKEDWPNTMTRRR
jgi:hypothetical protein